MITKCTEDLIDEDKIFIAGKPYQIRSVYISKTNGSVRVMALTMDETKEDFEIFLVFPPDLVVEVH